MSVQSQIIICLENLKLIKFTIFIILASDIFLSFASAKSRLTSPKSNSIFINSSICNRLFGIEASFYLLLNDKVQNDNLISVPNLPYPEILTCAPFKCSTYVQNLSNDGSFTTNRRFLRKKELKLLSRKSAYKSETFKYQNVYRIKNLQFSHKLNRRIQYRRKIKPFTVNFNYKSEKSYLNYKLETKHIQASQNKQKISAILNFIKKYYLSALIGITISATILACAIIELYRRHAVLKIRDNKRRRRNSSKPLKIVQETRFHVSNKSVFRRLVKECEKDCENVVKDCKKVKNCENYDDKMCKLTCFRNSDNCIQNSNFARSSNFVQTSSNLVQNSNQTKPSESCFQNFFQNSFINIQNLQKSCVQSQSAPNLTSHRNQPSFIPITPTLSDQNFALDHLSIIGDFSAEKFPTKIPHYSFTFLNNFDAQVKSERILMESDKIKYPGRVKFVMATASINKISKKTKPVIAEPKPQDSGNFHNLSGYYQQRGLLKFYHHKTGTNRANALQDFLLDSDDLLSYPLNHEHLLVPKRVLAQLHDITSPICLVYPIKTEFIENLKHHISSKYLSTPTKLKICLDISSAVAYLHTSHIILNELATRNCFINNHSVTKLCDSAGSKYIFPQEYESSWSSKNTGIGHFPIRWFSVEQFRFKKSTLESNVWALAVTFWEVFENGVLPYSGIKYPGKSLESYLRQGYRLGKPRFMPAEIYSGVLGVCWTEKSGDRGKVKEVIRRLKDSYDALNELFI